MESRDEGRPQEDRPAHDPDDPRGGGGVGGGPGTEGQELWKKHEEASKERAEQRARDAEGEPPEEEGSGPFERLS